MPVDVIELTLPSFPTSLYLLLYDDDNNLELKIVGKGRGVTLVDLL